MRLEKKINPKDLIFYLNSLDLDDGMRIDGIKKKIFVNKTDADEFVLQIKEDNGKEVISYHRTASSVVRLVNATFKGKLSVSTY
jgi:hypothetical protein